MPEHEYITAFCRVCGQPFEIETGKPGRPREYDTEKCRQTAQRVSQLQGLLAWLAGEHGFENRAALDGLYSELFTMTNNLNPRHKAAIVLDRSG
jgi:hypothetical protein